MAPIHHVFLVPGFFGFQRLGDMAYFSQVGELLQQRIADLGITARVHAASTLPTASLRTRAARLAETIDESVADEPGPIHLIGHSSGGLDVRLMVTRSVSLPTKADVERLADRTESVVTVATPHYGTPLADVVTSAQGQRILATLSLLTAHMLKFGHTPLSGAVRLGRVLLRLDDLVGLRGTVLDQLYEQLLGDFSRERSESLQHFLGHVRGDQALLPQLTPAGMDLLNAATTDREQTRYACVVTRARPPGLRSAVAVGFNPYAQVTQALYQVLYRITARMPESLLGPLSDQQVEALISGYGKIPAVSANDGMVPTRAQIWGRIIHIARADHLDVMGYFDDPPHVDWLASATGFDRQRFEALWSAVARHVVAE